MSSWKSFLKADPRAWLLEKDNPGVRRLALTGILDRPESDPEVKEAKHDSMHLGAIHKILAKQQTGGGIGRRPKIFTCQIQGNGLAREAGFQLFV
jgi:hypothetical protein